MSEAPRGILSAYAAGLRDLPRPEFRGVAAKSIALTLIAYVIAIALSLQLPGMIPSLGYEWIDTAVQILSGIGILFVLAVLFPIVVGGFVGLFLDDIAEAVERRHYPGDPPGRALAFLDALMGSLRFAGLALLLNVLALPFYLALLFLPPLNFVLFYSLNGYLIGREYFDLVATRHVSGREAAALRRTHRLRIIACGAVAAFIFTLPLAALLAPMLATAAFVHLFKRSAFYA